MRGLRSVVCVALLVLAAAAAGCGGGSASSSVTPADVQRFVAVEEATDNLGRLIAMIGTANMTVAQLEHQHPGSSSAQRLLAGSRIGWNNVLVGVNAFTPSQAAAVDGLAATVVGTRAAAVSWQNALDALGPRLRAGANDQVISSALAEPRKSSAHVRSLLTGTAAKLAQMACNLERAHPELAGRAAATGDCAAAAHLGAG